MVHIKMCIFFQKCQKMLEKADFGGKCSKIEKIIFSKGTLLRFRYHMFLSPSLVACYCGFTNYECGSVDWTVWGGPGSDRNYEL